MKLKCIFTNTKFPNKHYACYEDTWDNNNLYYVYEKVKDTPSQKLYMSKTQYNSFELVLKTNGWMETSNV